MRIQPNENPGLTPTAANDARIYLPSEQMESDNGCELNESSKIEAYELEVKVPEGFNTFDEYIRDWSEKHPMAIKESRILDAREINNYNWLSSEMRTERGDQLRYLGAFDYFMREDLAHLSTEEYTNLAYEFRDACLKAKDDPNASITLLGTTMKVWELDSMYESMSQAYNQNSEISHRKSDPNIYLGGNWLHYASDALQILSVKHSMQLAGVSANVVDMVTTAMDERSQVHKDLQTGQKFPAAWSELYEKLLQVDVSSKGNSRSEFGKIIDQLKKDVKQGWGGDYYLAQRIDQIASGYANGLKEMIKAFGLE